MPAKPVEKRVRHAVYFSPPRTADHQLLHRVIKELSQSNDASGFLSSLVLRGWLQILHGLPPAERSLQLRALDVPQEIIGEIDATAPAPAFVARAQASRVGAGVVMAHETARAQSPGPSAACVVPEGSKVGVVSAAGGLG